MDGKLKLAILKRDLQLLTDANDEYLIVLLDFARKAIIREGIQIPETDEGIELGMAAVHYAAYLYRKRVGTETDMPRFLRYELNNLLFSQKAKPDGKAVEGSDP